MAEQTEPRRWAHEWATKRSTPGEYRCRICGALKWKTAADEQPPCDGDARIIDGQAVQFIRRQEPQQ